MPATPKVKNIVTLCLYFIVIPFVLYMGIIMFQDRKYSLLSMVIAAIACIPFFLKYERRKPQAREIMVIAIMCALAIAGRMLFAFLPAFKPVSAIIIITGMAFGKEAGFMSGAITAIVSNIFFGQGPWTPFQMLSWGMIGYLAGVLNRNHRLERSGPLYIYAGFAGVLFSVIMDIWSAFSIDGVFLIERYGALLLTSMPFMVMYVVSNVIFLYFLHKPMIKKLNRVKLKYGIGEELHEFYNEL